MKHFYKIIALFFFICSNIWTLSAYELTSEDYATVNYLESKLFPIFDSEWEVITGKVLDTIDRIISKNTDKKINSLLKELHKGIEKNYNIGTYATALYPTPILNTPNFVAQFWGKSGVDLNFDSFWEIYAVEHTAVVASVFSIISDMWNDIYKVSTEEYPVANSLYVHADFLQNIQREQPQQRNDILPTQSEMIQKLKSIVWADYVWGGNIPEWIPQLLMMFPPKNDISEIKKSQWQLTWVDCSWLLYWASNGNTPRNTSWLINYGTSLDIAWKTLEEITPLLKLLDVIVWKWHMLIVLDKKHTIESAVSYSDTSLSPWVQIRSINDSLWEILTQRTPVNNYGDVTWSQFVITRWHY